jgi:hypothetical protein
MILVAASAVFFGWQRQRTSAQPPAVQPEHGLEGGI